MKPKLVQNIQHVEHMHLTEVMPPEKQKSVPVCPLPNTTRLFGRGEIIDELVGQLTTDDQIVACAVRGLPGAGKTDLVRAIGCDSRITAYFSGGVLYAELGQASDVVALLTGWMRAMDREPPATEDVAALAGMMRTWIGSQPALFILDDVWGETYQVARSLRSCATSACRILISTRSPDLADDLVGASGKIWQVPVLEPDPALALLHEQAPKAVEADLKGAGNLAAALGQLPLALKLAGRLLRNDRRSEKPCRALLTTWQQRLTDLQGPDEQRQGVRAEQLSLDTIIGLSYTALPDDATRKFAVDLAVFGPTPLSWDWPAMTGVWNVDEVTVAEREEALVRSGLLTFDDQTRRYSLHQIIHAFLAARVHNPEAYTSHVAYYLQIMKKYDRDIKQEATIDSALANLDREIDQMERAKDYAAMEVPPSMDQALVDFAVACGHYFELRGRYVQRYVWQETGLLAAQRQGDKASEAWLLNSLGNVSQLQGQYAEAKDYYLRSWAIQKQIGDMAGLGRTMGNLAVVSQRQRKEAEMLDFYQRDLETDIGGRTTSTIQLGNRAERQGRYAIAKGYYQRSLETLERFGHVSGVASILGNLGNMSQRQGQYAEAKDYYLRSLAIQKRIGDMAGLGRTMGNLGIMSRRQMQYAQAEHYYQAGLEVLERIGDVVGIASIRWKLGLLHRDQGHLHVALTLMEQCVIWEEQVEHPHALAHRSLIEGLRKELAESDPGGADR